MRFCISLSLCWLLATGCTCNRGTEPDLENPADSVGLSSYDQAYTTDELGDSTRNAQNGADTRGAGMGRGDDEATQRSDFTREQIAAEFQQLEDVQAYNPMKEPKAQERLAAVRSEMDTYLQKRNNLPNPMTIYNANCARCHGPEGYGDGPEEPNLGIAPTSFRDTELKFGADIEHIVYSTKYGQSEDEMPAHKDTLSDEQIWSVAFYVWEWVRNQTEPNY